MIDSYAFGRMNIDGQTYTKDVMILPDGHIVSPWWRKKGHKLDPSDIIEIIEAKPATLVVGTGNPGLMRPQPDLAQVLKYHGINLIIQPTQKAVQQFNLLTAESDTQVAACFHLTC